MSDQPQIQYATAEDGVRIAFWEMGSGVPLIHMPPLPISNIQKEWEFPPCRAYYEGLARDLKLVRYDCRGAGLSDRQAIDYSIDTHARDVLAVADRLGLERFALLGFGHSGTVAISVAALNPDRVSHLVLWCGYSRGSDYARGPSVEATRALMEQSWNLWTKAEGYRLSEWEGGENSRWFTEWVRESLSPAGTRAAVRALRDVDVADLLPAVQARSLVLHRVGLAAITVEMAREMASTIPHARLKLLDGASIVPYFGHGSEDVAELIVSFVLEPGVSVGATEPERPAETALTPREAEVLMLLAAGKTSSEISRELGLSIRTVGRHITHIYDKLGVKGRAEATAYALRNGMV